MLFFIASIMLTPISCAKSKDAENVFEELYYEVKSVKDGHSSVLLTGTSTAFADYDLGVFQNIQIPARDMALSFDEESLYILFFNHGEAKEWNTSFCVLYRYDLNDKKLYGEKDLDYLNDNFLSHYFKWCGNMQETGKFSLQDHGDYTFSLEENVTYN